MKKKYYTFFVLALLTSAVRFALRCYLDGRAVNSSVPLEYSDAESILSLGGKIDLASAGMYELELIPGISDRMAKNILESRTQVIDYSQSVKRSDRWYSLLNVEGISEKKARKFVKYIDF